MTKRKKESFGTKAVKTKKLTVAKETLENLEPSVVSDRDVKAGLGGGKRTVTVPPVSMSCAVARACVH